MPARILVFIPSYRCARQIGRVLAQFRGVPSGVFEEILLLDNGSDDDTLAEAVLAMGVISCCAVRVARNRHNYHLGGSHKAAFAYARSRGFTHVAVLHGDDQGCVRDLLPVIARGDHLLFDACLGARFMQGAHLMGYSRLRTLGNRVFNALFSAVSGRRVHDLGSGLNLFSAAIFKDADVQRYADDLRFNIYLLLDAVDKGRSLSFFPISWREDDQVSNVKMISQAWSTLGIAWQFLLHRAAFRKRDHRETSHFDYGFDTVALNGGHHA